MLLVEFPAHMLKIRMQRTGRTNEPQFRIVVGEHTIGPKSGKFLEKLGSYNPKTKDKSVDTDRVKYWMERGAQLSGTVHNMLIEMGVLSGKKVNVLPKKTVVAKVEEAKEEPKPAADVPAEPVAEEVPQEEAVAQAPEEVAPQEEAAA